MVNLRSYDEKFAPLEYEETKKEKGEEIWYLYRQYYVQFLRHFKHHNIRPLSLNFRIYHLSTNFLIIFTN